MFRIHDEAITPRKSHYEQAVQRLLHAHRQAKIEATDHLHRGVVAAAKDAGLDHSPIKVFHGANGPYVGLDHSVAGDKVADIEFGTPEEAPNPILRTAHRAHEMGANEVFSQVLWSGLGL